MANNNRILLQHQRKMLGILCGLLAPLSIIFGLFGDNAPEWWYSISATYFANSNMFIIGLLFSTSVYFFSYKGHDTLDDVLTTIAAVCAMGVVIFPTNCPGASERIGLFNLPATTSNIFHFTSAGLLFVSFAIMILFQFTKSNGSMTTEKKRRNSIYKICGMTILVVLVWQVATVVFKLGGWWTIINEFFMLLAFSIAWLVKAEVFNKLNDRLEA